MNEVIVVSGMTHKAGLLDEYQHQLNKAGVPFEIEPYPALPEGPNSVSMSVKIEFLRRVANKYTQFETIYNTDGWDVLFYGTHSDLVEKAPKTILISAERNCYPNSGIAHLIGGQGPWKYVNAGTLAANREYLLKWLDEIEALGNLGILDQAWYNLRLADGRTDLIPLDYTTSLFYVVSGNMEDGALKGDAGRPFNSATGTHPCFLHFSGSVNPTNVRNVINESLVSA